jgi:hypothetical protein
MELDSVLKKVRSLIAQAEHPTTDPVEAASYRAKADEMMTRYAIEEAQLRAASPVGERARPAMIWVQTASKDWEMVGYLNDLISHISRYTRCKVRSYDRYNNEDNCWEAKLYGFQSDLSYFELLYTSLRLHMLGVLRPEIDPAESLDENCYRLHNAGYNWLEIARMYGWKKSYLQSPAEAEWEEVWEHSTTGERASNHKVGSSYKRACYRACKARGEAAQRIPAGGTRTYRSSAAWGYVEGIRGRLIDIQGERGAGSEMALRVSMEDLLEFFKKDQPVYEPIPVDPDAKPKRALREKKYTPPPFSPAAYASGVRHARTADLMVGNQAPGPRTAVEA